MKDSMHSRRVQITLNSFAGIEIIRAWCDAIDRGDLKAARWWAGVIAEKTVIGEVEERV